MIGTYLVLLFGLTLYSYALIDPNITFFNHILWSRFLEMMLPLGYYERYHSWLIYVSIVLLLFFFNYLFVKHEKYINPIKLSIATALILLLSYPFLSHDFLKYMFDAKIVTVYHQNPYITPPFFFTHDPWLRFLHWVEQPFRYGPVFLGVSLIPSWLSGGKFLLSFLFFKATMMAFYLVAVYCLTKLNKRWGIMYASHPLIIIEGLVNGHNDLITATLIIVGMYWLWNEKIKLGRMFLFLSLGIKYFSFPILLLTRNKSKINLLIFLYFLFLPFSLLLPIMGELTRVEILSWYFINLLVFIPYYENCIFQLSLLFLGLLLSYYPFIRYGVWLKFDGFDVRHIIMVSFFIANIAILLNQKARKTISAMKDSTV